MSIYRDAGKIFFSPPFFPDPGQPEDPESIPRTAQEDELDEVRLALGEAMRARYEGTDQSYALWFDKLRLVSLQADRAVFACENNLKARIISDRFRDLILEALEEVLGYRPGLELKVDPPAAQDGQPKTGSQGPLSREDQIPLDPEDGGEGDEGWGDSEAGVPDFTVLRGQDGREGRMDAAGRVSWENGFPSSGPDGAAAFGVRPGYTPFEESFGSRPGTGSRPDISPSAQPGSGVQPSGAAQLSGAAQPAGAVQPSSRTPGPGGAQNRHHAFHDGYTFENFIVGSSNQMAHAAALRVADNVGMSINPLFIWGPSGLGKTHLMYAIANRAVERNPALRVICVKGEEFMNEMIEAIRNNRNQAFRDKYRKTDMLLIDDIQFIAGKDSTQTEFFHTFDALYEDRKQIIITSDRPPKELTSLENRIRSRFEAGLLVDIQPPDYELRMAILRDKTSQSGMEFPQDVMDFLAKNLVENIRQLEGVVKKLSMVHMVSGNPVTMETVLKTVPEYLRSTEPLSETVSRIIKVTAAHYGVRADDVLGKERKKNIQTARNVSMYLVRTVTGASLPQIAVFFYRDHSTVHSNIAKVEAEIAGDAVFEANVDEILKEVRRG